MKKLFQKADNLYGKVTIRNKFIILYSLVLFAVLLFIIIYFPSQLEKQAIYNAQQNLNTISELTAYSIKPALDFGDKDALDNFLLGVIRNKDIIFLIVKNEQDSVIYGYNFNKALSYNYSVINKGVYISEDKTFLECFIPIYNNQQIIGKLYVGMSLESVNERINKSRGSITLISILALLIGFILVYIITTLIVVPLNRLTKTIEEISHGDFSKRAIVNSDDEVGQLGSSFNIMLDKLQNAYNSLQEEINIRKQTEEKLIKAKEEVARALEQEKELNELRNRFISMVSHEYRTPLTAILSSTYLLDIFYKKGLTNEFEKQIKVIQTSVNDMTQLLEDVLALGKLDADVQLSKDDVLDLIELVNEQIIIMNVMDKSKHRVKFNNNLQDSVIKSNKKALVQIISNLLSNAAKYSPEETEILIELTEQNSYIMLSIKDEGIGIEKEDLEDIFEPFIRGTNVGVIQGTGLGLTIVKKTVHALGYVILVDSAKGKGSKFTLLIPDSK